MSQSKSVRIGGLDDLVDRLTDELNTPLSRSTNYQKIQEALTVGEEIDSNNITKLLEGIHTDLKSGFKYAANSLSIICLLMARYELQVSTETLNLCAFEVVNIIDKISENNNSDTLRILCWQTLVVFPNETILCLCNSHSQAVMGIIDSNIDKYLEEQKSKINNLILKFLHKILVALPSDEKEEFVKEDLTLWFGKVMPMIILSLSSFPENIVVLEMLTEALLPMKYDENPHWRIILENIYTPTKYPEIMKKLLQNGNDNWCRMWIVLIKLLKNQITKVNYSTGSPINSMLPVVELAFKKEPKYRIQAFNCWNVLIDNFSSELNEAYVNKRIKLLIIPLRSSNAKVEETALAKFDTWWNLITKYYSKMNKLTDMVLIPFLHFCFGNNMPNTNPIGLPPGQFSDNIQRQCLQALLEIFGHNACECVVTLPKLGGKLITTHILVQHWNVWIHSLNMVISTVINDQSGATRQYLKCLWKSFAFNIAELPENNIRKDLVHDFLDIITNLLQNFATNEKNADVALSVLLCALFEEQRILPLLKHKETDLHCTPVYKLLSKLFYVALHSISFNCDPKDLVQKLVIVTKVVIDEHLITPNEVLLLFKDLPVHNSTLMLWTGFSEALCKSSLEISPINLKSMVLWPLMSVVTFSEKESNIAWNSWRTLYESITQNNKIFIEQNMTKWLKSTQHHNTPPSHFQLSAILFFLKNKLVKNDLFKCKEEIILLENILKESDKIKGFEEGIPLLVDTVISILSKVEDEILINGVQIAFITLYTIKMIYQLSTLDQDLKNQQMFIDILLKGVEKLIKKLPVVINHILDTLLGFISEEHKHYPLNNKIILLLQNLIQNNKDLSVDTKNKISSAIKCEDTINKISSAIKCEDTKNKISSAIKCADPNKTVNNNTNVDTENQKNFTSPKAVPMKSNKKEPSIVNSVVLNGENYVVVKSHWSFNPKKLTENQIQKFKRKREDIPALYQDLSQSQDEFKMMKWKTDSQDTSNTASSKSNSKSEADASSILKNMPSTDVVPHIIENIFADHTAKDSNRKNNGSTDNKPLESNTPKIKKVVLATKDSKSPRMALKDRVFKNVRNLIEKSGINQCDNQNPDEFNKTVDEDVLKTPSSSTLISSSSDSSSAPPKINTERPTRVIKKPRKFDDVQLLSIKKRRRSRNSNEDSQMKLDFVTIASVATENDRKTQLEFEKHDVMTKSDTNVPFENKTEEERRISNNMNVANSDVSKEICTEKGGTSKVQDKDTDMNKDDDVACDAAISNKDSKVIVEEVQKENVPSPSPTDSEINNQDKNDEKNKSDKIESDINIHKTSTKDSIEDNNKKDESIQRKDGKKAIVTSTKKKKSRIEKQLLIDTVEGHPFLQVRSDRRVSRRINQLPENNSRRKSLTEKNKAKIDQKSTPNKNEKKRNSKDKSPTNQKCDTITVEDSQENNSQVLEDLPQSEDVIESSQDSTMTTISASSTNRLSKIPIVKIDDKVTKYIKSKITSGTQDILKEHHKNLIALGDFSSKSFTDSSTEDKDDTAFPNNKTLEEQKSLVHDLTEEMDTQPIEEKNNSDLLIVSDDKDIPIMINTEDDTIVGIETQEIAEADTLSMDIDIETSNVQSDKLENSQFQNKSALTFVSDNDIILSNTPDDFGELERSEPVSKDSTCSPLKSDEQRKKSFLNDTIEISPIKTMSPLKDQKSPSPETSSDFVVIKLATPVQSNGEPFEKCDSPEIFTEDKTSPDKRDQSPPRTALTVVNNFSPSSSLSLKKNRPQMRSSGRAAQMLGLCAIMNSDEPNTADVDEPKRNNTISTPVRRNLRIMYSSVGDNSESQPETTNPDESEDSEKFLKLKRALPTADCNPAVPILKRKLADIADEATVSPASKRKRVSFHDPPVSTTVAVTKYIESGCIRSPQNSVIKRKERQLRASTTIKSAKRLDNVFKLDTVLTNTIESFNAEPSVSSIDDVELSSMDTTPVVEIVKTSDLNDTDAISPELINCIDSIINIASELSSPAMKDLFIKEIEGKVKTVGDLAKMTELEVNRLCIKAPKIRVAKQALSNYAKKVSQFNCHKKNQKDLSPPIESKVILSNIATINVEVQTLGVELKDIELQTDRTQVSFISTQTESHVKESSAQTNESGVKTTRKIVKECVAQRPDFIAQLKQQLPESSVKEIAAVLSPDVSMDLLMQRVSTNPENIPKALIKLNPSLLNLQKYLLKRFDNKDLLLFCSQMLQEIHDKKL